MSTDVAMLIQLKISDFSDRKTGEVIQGFSVFLGRPCRDPRFEGYGTYIYKISDFAPGGISRGQEFLRQANGLFMRTCQIEFEDLPLANGNLKRSPRSIRLLDEK